MSNKLQAAYEQMTGLIDQTLSQSEWFEITQQRIDDYADVSIDHQWIHVDVERAQKESPYGGPIAHGNLMLALMGHMPMAIHAPKVEGQKLGINYGFDRIRFPAPVHAGTRIRETRILRRVEIKGDMLETMMEVVIEAEDTEKPVCVAERIGRIVF